MLNLSSNDLATAIATIVAVIALVNSIRVQRRQLAFQEQQIDIAKRQDIDRQKNASKAWLHAKIIRDHDIYLEITNMGPSRARDIEVLFDGKNPSEWGMFTFDHVDVIPVLDPERHAQYQLSGVHGIVPPSNLTMRWSDDSGEIRVSEGPFPR